MKTVNKSIPVRILTAAGGLVLLGLAALMVAEGFFHVPLTARLTAFLAADGALAVLCRIVAGLALVVLAGCCVVCALPSRQPKQTGSIMQKGADGSFGITVGAIEKMVLACAAKHPEILHADVDVRQVREGVVLLMNVQQVGGVSIPLSIARLQKQVREYVAARTGLDVAEVRVMVDNADDNHVASEFTVEDRVVPSAPVHTEDYTPATAVGTAVPVVEKLAQIAEITSQPIPVETAGEEDASAAVTALPAEPVDLDKLLPIPEAPPELVDMDERPLHQRVFGAEEMPQMVPVPPEMAMARPEEDEPVAAPDAGDAEAEGTESSAEPAAEEAPAQPVQEPVEEDWTEPALQAAADEVLSGDVTDAGADGDDPALPLEADAEREADKEPEALM
ncbi:MAG: hypothetical protein IKK57_04875 [Clostridia bacterium]|nr:hypothetical protein [Clostridia bacterium]